jgi:hypothetical protein
MSMTLAVEDDAYLDIAASDDLESINQELYRRGMTDGLPVIPPTQARVERMLAGLGRDPQESLGAIGPAYGEATLEKIAVNAVMAGCAPEHLKVVAAAVEAMLAPEFNLYGVNATTHPVGPMLVINGPAAEELGVNYGYNCMGQGWRANATIGRAIRLVMINIGGGRPGHGDRATHGTPAKFSFCFAENEKASPWAPLHVRRGFEGGQSTVTVHASEAPHEVNNHTSLDGYGVLKTIASSLATLGHNNSYLNHGEVVVCMGPEHAQTIARDGFGIEDVQEFLFVHARNRGTDFAVLGRDNHAAMKPFNPKDPASTVPIVMKATDFLITVAGGAGKHTMVMPSFGLTRSVTREIR